MHVQTTFPVSATQASRKELSAVPLRVRQGQLPSDLGGHLFFVAPVGTVSSGGLPAPDATPILNGDGMVYRLDLGGGEARLSSRLMKTPCYYADMATRDQEEFASMGFRNQGLSRFSHRLGFRNFLNTALLPTWFPGDPNPRLLATYDAGRPFEIDPYTLEVVTPVGSSREWQPFGLEFLPFALNFTSAHPTFDPLTGELFTVNYGTSLGRLATTMRPVASAVELPAAIRHGVDRLVEFFSKTAHFREHLDHVWKGTEHFKLGLLEYLRAAWPNAPRDFTFLSRWTGDGLLERWRLVNPDGSPVLINQTVHQLGITRDYVVLMDTGFKFSVDELYISLLQGFPRINQLLRYLTSRAQSTCSTVYLVPRYQLERGQRPTLGEPEQIAIARKVTIPLETVHFLVDYENPDGLVTLHATHGAATDVAEWIREYDVLQYNNRPMASYLRGLPAMGEMDISRMGKYVINATEAVLDSTKVVTCDRCTWAMAFYAANQVPSCETPAPRLDNIFWYSGGYWPEFLSRFVYNLYDDYPLRITPVDRLKSMVGPNQKPCTLFRLDTHRMDFMDVYTFGDYAVPASPQFIPREGGTGGSTDGYILVNVFAGTEREIWIFKGWDLAAGPVTRLAHPDLEFALTLHTAYLPHIAPRTAQYCVPIREDYDPLIQDSPRLKALFEQHVYPNFPTSATA